MSASDDFKRKRPPRSELRKLRRSLSTGSASMSATQTMTVTAEPDSGNSSGMNSEPETKYSDIKTVVLPDKPVHVNRESLFSSSSGFVNYRGLLNDCLLLLVLSNSKNVLSNLLKYGILVDPVSWANVVYNDPSMWPSVCTLILSFIFVILTVEIEKALLKAKITPRTLLILHGINLLSILLLPCLVMALTKPTPLVAGVMCMSYTILWLKMVSYVQVNYWCRQKRNKVKKMLADNVSVRKQNLVWYPDNIGYGDMFYFLFAPTLCYELNFPRTPKINRIFLLRRIVESVFLFFVLVSLFQQWLVPAAQSSVKPFKEMDLGRTLERIITLALPNHLLWLIFFYLIFHSVMNLLAELLRFGDRQFYQDWWNAQSVSQFWSHWNIPVYRWCSRHVYHPLIGMGCPKLTAKITVFLLSAFFHEYLVSIPLRMIRVWAFSAMLFQVPLAYITSFRSMRGQIGNVIVWISIVLGQPLAIVMYMHDYYAMQYGTVENPS